MNLSNKQNKNKNVCPPIKSPPLSYGSGVS
jgi:hypothetical protein